MLWSRRIKRTNPSRLKMAISTNRLDQASVGVYGTRARRLTKELGIKVDYWFNAFDNSVLGACEGRDFVLLVDDQMVSMVESRLQRLQKDFNLSIGRKRVDFR